MGWIAFALAELLGEEGMEPARVGMPWRGVHEEYRIVAKALATAEKNGGHFADDGGGCGQATGAMQQRDEHA